jgi:hypothetical protein
MAHPEHRGKWSKVVEAMPDLPVTAIQLTNGAF